MPGIVYDASMVKICEAFYQICEYAEFSRDWANELWMDILTSKPVMEELVYYIENHTFLDKCKVLGYSMCDLYVWQMSRYNLIQDTGKNSRTCNKEKMVMKSFRTMIDMVKEPEKYRSRLERGEGMDRL